MRFLLARQPVGLAIVTLTLLGIPRPGAAQEDQFLAWARQDLRPIASVRPDARLSDLGPIRQMIGNATVVSFGEGLHGGAEPLEFRNLLFRFLVEDMGFTAIAIESGISDGFSVNEYVLGGPGELEKVVARGFTFGFNRLPQNIALVRWMREYNADPQHSRKIEFYGFDVPPGDPRMPLEDALRYLEGVDSTAATAVRDRTKMMLPMLNLDRLSDTPNQYSQLAQPMRDQMTAAITDLNTLFRIHQAEYVAASSARAYELAQRSAVIAAQVDEYMRQVPVGWTPGSGMAALSGTIAVSDRSKADNAHWVKEQQGPGGKILLFAHRDHIATTMVTIRIPENNAYGLPPEVEVYLPPMMGTYLKPHYGVQLVTIGNLLAEDNSGCRQKRSPAPSGSLEAQLSTLNTPYFLLDLRTAPPRVASWLQRTRELYGIELPDSLKVGMAFDIVFFSRLVTPAEACS